MVTVKYYGELANLYGDSFKLHVANLYEFLEALKSFDEFSYIQEAQRAGVYYQILINGDLIDFSGNNFAQAIAQFNQSFTDDTVLYLIPYYMGGFLGKIGKWIDKKVFRAAGKFIRKNADTILEVASYFGSVSTLVASGVIAYANRGYAKKLAKNDETSRGGNPNAYKVNSGTSFSSASNEFSNGQLIPIVYGRCLVGSIVVESTLKSFYSSNVRNIDKRVLKVNF